MAASYDLCAKRKVHMTESAASYFLSNLIWPLIALSNIATYINGYQFLLMIDSAYLFGFIDFNSLVRLH